MLIRAESVTFRHPQAEVDTLHNISFSVPEGALCCVVGMNGSGKSSLLGLLAGVYTAKSGKLEVDGVSLPANLRALQGKVALVPQDPDVYILGSLVEEDLLLGLDAGDAESHQRALELAAAFGLADLLRHPVHTLSYGQKRKLCLASALATQPRLLLLDEPFAGLDHPAALAMRDLLRRNHSAGLTQVVVAHDLDLLADLADSLLLLRHGEIASFGRPETVFPTLLDAGVRPPCCWGCRPKPHLGEKIGAVAPNPTWGA